MQKIVLAFILVVLSSCSGGHQEVFVFNKQAYTTYNVSEFEVAHYNLFGNSNLLYLEDESDENKDDRSRKLTILCKNYEMDCENLNITDLNSDTATEIVNKFKSYKDKKFLLISPSKAASSKFFGVINLVEKSGDRESLKAIFKQIGLEDAQEISDQFFEIYFSNQETK